MPGVEGLRALAAASIVLVHVWGFSAPSGGELGSGRIADALSTLSVGVTLFFTLSGFLLYRSFAAPIARGVPRMPIGAYVRNRVLRIAPAYWVILVVIAVLFGAAAFRDAGGSLHDASGNLHIGRLTHPADLIQAVLLLQNYRRSTFEIGITPAWSLAVEAVFYCALPLLVLGAARVARSCKDRRGRVIVLLGPPVLLLLVGLSGKAVAAHLLSGAPTVRSGVGFGSIVERSFWAQADLFSFGMAVAVLHTEMSDGRLVLPAHWRRAALGLGLLLFLPSAWTMHQREHTYVLQNTGEALGIAFVFAAIIVPDRKADTPMRVVRLLETPALVAVGVASYSLFLWHYPVISWLRVHGITVGGWSGLLVNLVLVAAVAGALSALTYRFVERPALRRKRRTRAADRPPGAIAAVTEVSPGSAVVAAAADQAT